jgi:hypothetical protein
MSKCLVVAQAVTQGPLERDHRGKETIVCRASPQHLPEPLNHLELGAVTWQSVQLQMRHVVEACGDQGSCVPGGVVDHQDHTRIPGGGVGACQIPQMPDEHCLEGVLCRRGPLALHDPCAQMASHQIQRAKDIGYVMAIQIADHGSMPFKPQGRPQRRDHREARLILTQQDQFPRLGFFLRPADPVGPPLVGPGRL